jgi:O-antigen biosynthesis protein
MNNLEPPLKVLNPFAHYFRTLAQRVRLQLGKADGLSQGSIEAERTLALLRPTGLFDPDWYLKQYPDIGQTAIDPLLHYLTHGASEGRNPNPFFSTRWYVQHYPDVSASSMNPLLHYLVFGAAEERDPGPLFSTRWYSQRYRNVISDSLNPLAYFLKHGLQEGHEPIPLSADLASILDSSIAVPLQEDPKSCPLFCQWYDWQTPEVSIVILNLNKPDLTRDCLRSLWQYTQGYRYEIILVDNGSDAQNFTQLLGVGSGCRLLRLPTNRYFGEGNNIGVEATRGQFLVFLNNDTVVTEDWLQPLIDPLVYHSEIGGVGAVLLYPDGLVQEAGGLLSADGQVIQRGKGLPALSTELLEATTVDYCSAACFALRRTTFEVVLGFDPIWEPAYYEDLDLCLKIKALDLKIIFAPESCIYHIESATFSSDNNLDKRKKLQISAINRIKFLLRWGPWLATRKAEHLPKVLPQWNHYHLPETKATSAKLGIGIFTPNSLRIGGGERYLLKAAQTLSTIGEVFLITQQPYSRLRLLAVAESLSLNLEQLEILTLYEARKHRGFDLFLAIGNEILPLVEGLGKVNLYHCQFPFRMDPASFAERWPLWEDYQGIVVNSSFTAESFEQQRQQLDLAPISLQIISPPVSAPMKLVSNPLAARRKSILSVGRFFSDAHCKRQDILIQAFKQLLLTVPDLELNLVGALGPSDQDRNFLEYCRLLAEDIPIQFHLDIAQQDLDKLYSDSLIYWHATGFNVDEAVLPEKCEHFGISILEAMARGCIPIVCHRGFPARLVQPRTNGYTFETIQQLVEISASLLISTPDAELLQLQEGAIATAQNYSPEHFEAQWLQLAAQYLPSPSP